MLAWFADVWTVLGRFASQQGALGAISVIVVAVLPFLLHRENRRLREVATADDPRVVVYIEMTGDPRGRHCFFLVVENLGPGIARDVRVDGAGFGLLRELHKSYSLMPPRSKSELELLREGSGGSDEEVVDVQVSYEDNRGKRFKHHYKTTSREYLTHD